MTRANLRFTVFSGAAAIIICLGQNLVPPGFGQTGTAVIPSKPALSGFPFTNERLTYTVNWPSGLSLGEGHMSATSDPSGWRYELSLDAGIPGYTVKDTYRASSTGEYCSASLSKDSVHGARKSNETVAINGAIHTATRHSNYGGSVGGTTNVSVPACVRDALTFLYYTRRELGQGRVPTTQQIIFGSLYTISLTYAGAETITVSDKRILTDKILCHVKGPASDRQFEAYFDRDPARTPVSIRVPLIVGTFSLEIVR